MIFFFKDFLNQCVILYFFYVYKIKQAVSFVPGWRRNYTFNIIIVVTFEKDVRWFLNMPILHISKFSFPIFQCQYLNYNFYAHRWKQKKGGSIYIISAHKYLAHPITLCKKVSTFHTDKMFGTVPIIVCICTFFEKFLEKNLGIQEFFFYEKFAFCTFFQM